MQAAIENAAGERFQKAPTTLGQRVRRVPPGPDHGITDVGLDCRVDKGRKLGWPRKFYLAARKGGAGWSNRLPVSKGFPDLGFDFTRVGIADEHESDILRPIITVIKAKKRARGRVLDY